MGSEKTSRDKVIWTVEDRLVRFPFGQWVGEPDVLRIGVSILSQVYIVYIV